MSTFFQALGQSVGRFLADEEGVTAIEYGLIAALVAVAIVTAVTLLGTNLATKFRTICASIKGSTC